MVTKRNVSKKGLVGGRNPELTRKRILAAALRQFVAHGYAGARVDTIAAKARINKRMLYHYFGDKRALFRAVLRQKITERSAWASASPENPFDALPAWFDLCRRDPDWVRLLEWEGLQWRDAKIIDESHRRQLCLQAVARMRDHQEKGLVPADLDPAQLLLSWLALSAYPFAFPQLARLITGHKVSGPEFARQRTEFLRRFADHLRPADRS